MERRVSPHSEREEEEDKEAAEVVGAISSVVTRWLVPVLSRQGEATSSASAEAAAPPVESSLKRRVKMLHRVLATIYGREHVKVGVVKPS